MFGRRHKTTTPPQRSTKPQGKRVQQTIAKPPAAKPTQAPPAKQEGRPIKTSSSGAKAGGGTKAVSTKDMAKIVGGSKNGKNKG